MKSRSSAMSNSIMETVYIAQNDISAECRASFDPTPVDQPPPYSLVHFPPKATINAPTAKQSWRVISRPNSVFRKQVQRHVERLDDQSVRELQGRKLTFPFDLTCDFLANAENNVFRSWAAAGICPPEWGAPWPADTERSSWKVPPGGPQIGAYWPHEEYKKPAHGLDLAASRPSRVFTMQWDEEFKWCCDEARFQGRKIDEDQLRQESLLALKNFWIEDKLWDPRWIEYPGDTWMHEIEEHAIVSHPPTYAELFGPQSNDKPQKTVRGSEENIAVPPPATSSRNTRPQTRRTKSTKSQAQAAPRRSARIAALNQTRAATSGISKAR